MSVKNIAMAAQKRDGTGKGSARAARRENKIPAVIYGNNQSPVTITLDEKAITMAYHTGSLYTTLVDIDVDGTKELVLARDVQTHVVKDTIQHVDFLRVSAKTKIAVMVPVNFINEGASPALAAGAILNTVRHEVELLCQATSIPEALDVDLTDKDYGDSVNISDAKLPEGVKPVIDDRDFTVATLVEPKAAPTEEELSEGSEAPEASEVPADNGGEEEASAEDA